MRSYSVASNFGEKVPCETCIIVCFHSAQIDNARDFSDMGGFAVLKADLNHTEADVRAAVAHVIGSAAQRSGRTLLFIIHCAYIHFYAVVLPTSCVAHRLLSTSVTIDVRLNQSLFKC